MSQNAAPDLVMRFATGSVKHFGLQMYSTPAPAIAELIANAWDADASQVSIHIPLGTPINPQLTITVTDNGLGMTADDFNEKFLIVGREKRRHTGGKTPANGTCSGARVSGSSRRSV